MFTLVVVGLLGGLITSVSPCILPVLPIVLAAGMTSATEEGKSVRRPVLVVAGLVVSFSLATLFGSLILSSLDLPQDTLRNAGIAVLIVVGLGMLIPRLGELLERPFARLQRRAVRPGSQGLGLGLALGLVYVPCAGPVLAAIAVVGATHRVGLSAFLLTLFFAIGIALPLLAFALAGEQAGRRIGVFRKRMREVRLGGGVLLIGIAVAIAFNAFDGLQRLVPGYTNTLQNKIENNASASKQLHKLTTTAKGVPMMLTTCQEGASNLRNCGPAPDFAGISTWLNTPDGKPLSLAALKGHVVLLDFWTYSCINCQRALPHVEAWYQDLPRGRVRRGRRAHAGVRLRARDVQRAVGRSILGRQVPDRDRQRLRHLELLQQPVLAGRMTALAPALFKAGGQTFRPVLVLLINRVSRSGPIGAWSRPFWLKEIPGPSRSPPNSSPVPFPGTGATTQPPDRAVNRLSSWPFSSRTATRSWEFRPDKSPKIGSCSL